MAKKNEYMLIILGLIMAVLFGHSFLFTGSGLDVLSPVHLLALRFLLSALIFGALRVFGIIEVNFKGKNLVSVTLLCLTEPVCYFMFEALGIKYTSTSETGMFIAVVPVVTTLLGAVVLKEKPTFIQFCFVSLTVLGAIFMVVMKESIAGVGSNIFGTMIIFCAVISQGIYNVFSRKLSTQFTPYELTYSMMWIGAISFNIMSVVEHLLHGNIANYFTPLKNPQALISVLYLGAVSAIFGYFILNYLLSKMEVSRTAVFLNLATVISIFAGVVFRNEDFYWFNAVGVIMILLGVWGTNRFNKPIERRTYEHPAHSAKHLTEGR